MDGLLRSLLLIVLMVVKFPNLKWCLDRGQEIGVEDYLCIQEKRV